MIMYFAVIASVPFTVSGCTKYLIWRPDHYLQGSIFHAYGVALYVTTVVSLVGWVS